MNAAESTPYEVLSVPRDASSQDIKRAYRKLQRVVHPDAGGNDALFRIVQAAYETLSDPARRSAYDAGDTSAFQASASQQPSPNPHRAPEDAAADAEEARAERAARARRERADREYQHASQAARAAHYYPYGTLDTDGSLASPSRRLQAELDGLRGSAPHLFRNGKALRARLADHRAEARVLALEARARFSWKFLLISTALMLGAYLLRVSDVVTDIANTPDGSAVRLGPLSVGNFYVRDEAFTPREHVDLIVGALVLSAVCWSLVALRARWAPLPVWEAVGLWALVAVLFGCGEHVLTQPVLAAVVPCLLLAYVAWWLLAWRLPRPLSAEGWCSVRIWLLEMVQDAVNLLRVRAGRS